jgi:hypothetical protein
MTEIESTLAVSIKDEVDNYDLKINSDGEILGLSQIWDGTRKVEVTTDNKLKSDVNISDFETPNNKARVNAAGQLQVSSPPPSTPGGKTGVTRLEYSSVSGSVDNVYIIPNGETLTVQRLSAGAEEDNTAGNVIELWYDPLGTGIDMTIIAVLFVNSSSAFLELDEDYTGNGTRTIRLRRRRLGGGAKLIFAKWEGYY